MVATWTVSLGAGDGSGVGVVPPAANAVARAPGRRPREQPDALCVRCGFEASRVAYPSPRPLRGPASGRRARRQRARRAHRDRRSRGGGDVDGGRQVCVDRGQDDEHPRQEVVKDPHVGDRHRRPADERTEPPAQQELARRHADVRHLQELEQREAAERLQDHEEREDLVDHLLHDVVLVGVRLAFLSVRVVAHDAEHRAQVAAGDGERPPVTAPAAERVPEAPDEVDR